MLIISLEAITSVHDVEVSKFFPNGSKQQLETSRIMYRSHGWAGLLSRVSASANVSKYKNIKGHSV